MIKLTLDGMARILKVTSPEKYLDRLDEDTGMYGFVLVAAIQGGLSVEEAEERAMEAERRERDEAFCKYTDNLLSVFQAEAENLDLGVEELKTKPGVYRVFPQTSWKESAEKTREIVNGISGFYFGSLREFLDAGPYSPHQAVKAHIGYLGQQAELYGYPSPRSRIEHG